MRKASTARNRSAPHNERNPQIKLRNGFDSELLMHAIFRSARELNKTRSSLSVQANHCSQLETLVTSCGHSHAPIGSGMETCRLLNALQAVSAT